MRRAGFWIGAMLAAMACSAAAQVADGDLTAAQRRAISASGLPRAQVVSVKRDLVVAIRNRGTFKGGVLVEGISLQGEVVGAEAARALGYKSLRSTVNVDCARRRDMVTRLVIYPESSGRGEGIQRQVPGGWVQPSPDAYLGDVIRAVCADVARPAPPPVEKTERPPQPAERPVRQAASAPPPKPAAPPPPASEPLPAPAPYGSELMVTAVGVRPAPQPAGQPASQAPSPPMAMSLRPAVAPPSVAAAKTPPQPAAPPAPKREAPPAAKPAPKPGNVRVQIAAVATAAKAQEALAKLGKLPAPLGRTVQATTVDGRTLHRALVTGFATRTEAQAFCTKVEGRGGACFIR